MDVSFFVFGLMMTSMAGLSSLSRYLFGRGPAAFTAPFSGYCRPLRGFRGVGTSFRVFYRCTQHRCVPPSHSLFGTAGVVGRQDASRNFS
jgi:hypothetical protein